MHRLMKQIGEQLEVSCFLVKLKIMNPFTPMSNQDRISPDKIKQTSDENREKYKLGDYKQIQYQILQTNITRTVWQTVKRIINEILGVKGFIQLFPRVGVSLGRKLEKSFQCQGKVTLNSSQGKMKFEGKNGKMRVILKDDECGKNTKII